MRYEKIKIWPEITGFTPALIFFRSVSAKKKNPILVQFSGIQKVDSTGLAILLCRLIQLYNKAPYRKWIFHSTVDLSEDIEKVLVNLGFFHVISKYQPNEDLFLSTIYFSNMEKLKRKENGITKKSYPIYFLDYKTQKEPRDTVEDFIEWIDSILKNVEKDGYKFKRNAFLQMLKEIAKNSEDHTLDNAFFGIDLIENTSNNLTITFSFCDLGIGIYRNILDVLTDNPTLFKDKNKHLGLTDVYQFAMTLNNSCPRNNTGRNRGLGMSIIHDAAQVTGIELSVFDAQSRGLINKLSKISHEELRKYFISFGNPTGFFYYGELSLIK